MFPPINSAGKGMKIAAKIVYSVIVCTEFNDYFDGLVQDCSNSSVLAMELLQSCAKPLIFLHPITWMNTTGDINKDQK